MESKAWSLALDQSRALLSDADARRYGSSTPATIIGDLMDAHVSRNQSSKIQAFLRRIQPMVSALERYGGAMDVFVNASPEALSPIWGGIRVLLIVAKDYGSYFIKLTDMLQVIGDGLPRFQAYEQLFQNHEPLHAALLSMYTEIVAFIARAKGVFSKSSFRIFGRALWKTFDQTFHSSLAELRRYSDLIEREAKLAHMLEASIARLELTMLSSVVRENSSSSLRARQCHEELSGIQNLPGTGEWILHSDQYLQWINKLETQIFWVHGSPGCGKSYLYTKILNDIEGSAKMPYVHFLFCGADRDRVTVSSLVRSWVIQLANIFQEAKEHLTAYRAGCESHVASNQDALAIFRAFMEFLPPIFLTVDALDECDEQGDLQKLLFAIPPRFKVLVTSRYIRELSIHLGRLPKGTQQTLEVLPSMSKADVNRYINHQLDHWDHDVAPNVLAQVKEKLVNSGGMFLWIKLMLQDIEEQATSEEILQCLNDSSAPTGLDERYNRVIARILTMTKPRQLLAHKAFFWVTVARRPLAVKELCGLLAVKPGASRADGYDPMKRVTSDPTSSVLSACSSLLVARGDDKLLYPMHFTVTEYLRKYVASSERVSEMTAYYDVSQLNSSDSLAAAVCLRYLSSNLVETLVDKVPTSHREAAAWLSSENPELDALNYASCNWFQHLRRVQDPVPLLRGLLLDMIERRHRNLDIAWHLYWFSGSNSGTSAICPQEFSGAHIAAYFGLDAVLKQIITRQGASSCDHMGRSALWWAVNRGNASCTKLLLDAGLDANTPDDSSISAVHRGAALGNMAVFEHLISAQSQDGEEVVDGEGWTPLHWAASKGHTKIAQRICSYSKGRKAYGNALSVDRLGRTPIHLAASNGFSEIITELSWSADRYNDKLNARDSEGQTPMHLAAARGHGTCVEALLRLSAASSLRDGSGRTPAERAKDMGHMSLYDALNSVASVDDGMLHDEDDVRKLASRMSRHKLDAFNTRLDRTQNYPEEIQSSSDLDGQDMSLMHATTNRHAFSLMVLIRKSRAWDVRDSRNRTLLHHAAAVGDVVNVKSVFGRSKGLETLPEGYVDLQDDRGWTALHYAVAERFPAVVTALLKAGASPMISTKDGQTPYDRALTDRHAETFEALARARIPSDRLATDLGWNEMHKAVWDGIVPVVTSKNKSFAQERDLFGRLPLYRALEVGNWKGAEALHSSTRLTAPELVALALILVEDTSQLEALTYTVAQLPPLCLAAAAQGTQAKADSLLVVCAKHGHIAGLASLLSAGVDIDAKDMTNPWRGATALEGAIESKNTDAAIYLIESGANVSLEGRGGNSMLCLAGEANLAPVVESLLNHGAQVDQRISARGRHDAGMTPLAYMMSQTWRGATDGMLETAKILLEHGADVLNLGGDYEKAALWLAIDRWTSRVKHLEYQWPVEDPIIALFQSRGLDPLIQPLNKDKLAKIHVAVSQGDVISVEHELDQGIPVDWPSFNMYNPTPLALAAENNDVDMVRLLLERDADLTRIRGYLDTKRGLVEGIGPQVKQLLWQAAMEKGLVTEALGDGFL